MVLGRLRRQRQAEQDEFDAIIEEAKKKEQSALAAEKSDWGCNITVPTSVVNRVFSDNEETLLIPLIERALCTRDYEDMFDDRAAVCVRKVSPFKGLKRNADADSFLHGFEQSHYIAVCKNFIKRNPRATIVEVGCGLSTLWFQLAHKEISCIEIDTKDVLNLRNELGFDNDSRVSQIGCDPHDFSWIKEVKRATTRDIVIVAYIHQNPWPSRLVKELMLLIKEEFTNALLLLNCVGGKAGRNREGFRLYDLNAKSVFHSWSNHDPKVQVFETVFPHKKILEEIKREERRNIKRLYRDGNQILIDLKFAE